MAAHRYWALSLLARDGAGNGVSVAEVEMRGTPGGADLCTGGTAGGAFTSSLPPANAFDDNNSTIWYNGSTGGGFVRLSYDFGAAVDIVELRVRNSPSGGTAGLPGATFGPAFGRVEWSDDGTTWKIGVPALSLGVLGNAEEMVIGGVSDAAPPGRALAAPPTLQCFPPAWPASPRTIAPPVMLVRVFVGGNGRIVGTVTIKGTPNVPVRRRVRLYREIDGVCVGEQWSDAVTGAYAFVGFDRTITYTVLAYDGPRVFKATLADGVIPELIP